MINSKKSTSISYSEVGLLSKLTRDYLDGKPNVAELYNLESNSDSIPQLIQERQFSTSKREVLVEVLQEQYGELKSKKVFKNIESLLLENTYTVTTGHQLNLFTGPLYFIYKIVSAIKTAEELSQKYPENNFIPVYWMATEDHDFEEINHTYINGNKIQWNSDQTGMVGEFSLDGIEDAVSQFCSELGNSIASQGLRKTIEKAYLGASNLAEATRVLVHYLFQSYGLVIIDGNHPTLKNHFIPVIAKELFERASFKSVSETISSFEDSHKAQVNPREINLFYVIPGIRERIMLENDRYVVNNTDLSFSKTEIHKEFNLHPERFSPNVILRPVYQECVLPNLVYIGGGAEVAYWLELKSTFDSFQIPYPLVQIRDSFLMLSAKDSKKMTSLNLSVLDLFKKKDSLVKDLVDERNPLSPELLKSKSAILSEIKSLQKSLVNYDRNLEKSVGAAQAGLEKVLERLETKVSGAVKRNQEDEWIKLDSLFESVYPGGVYQERRINFFEFYAQYGSEFLDRVFENTRPFCRGVRVLLR